MTNKRLVLSYNTKKYQLSMDDLDNLTSNRVYQKSMISLIEEKKNEKKKIKQFSLHRVKL